MRRLILGLGLVLGYFTRLVAGGEVIARCGEGYLEMVDGYRVLHVKGTPYQMGFQQGTLLRENCLGLMDYLFNKKAGELKIEFMGVKMTPKQVVAMIFTLQRSHIPERYVQEMQGIADALGIDEMDVFTANGIPELFHCSGFALLKETTKDGALLHGRVLDYGIDWKLQEHAVLVIAEPQGRIPFANVSYAGFIGSVTGMNREQISIGEMGGRGMGKWAGTPMSFLVRRVLEEADSLDKGLAIFRDSKRTCEYYYVLGDGRRNQAAGLDGSADRFRVVKPGEAHELLPTPVPNTVLLSAGDRYKNLCRLVSTVRDSKEQFTVEQAIRLMDAPVAMKSNLHNALMAPGTGKLWVANASSDGKPAWTQKYYGFDFWKLLEQPAPTTGKEYDAPPKERPTDRPAKRKVAATLSAPVQPSVR